MSKSQNYKTTKLQDFGSLIVIRSSGKKGEEDRETKCSRC
jgi:hypothetical protein